MVEIKAATAIADERICSSCKICGLVCPFSAISFDEKALPSSFAQVLPTTSSAASL